MKFSTCTIASFGSTMRKYATALTRAGTLSFVMTSCGGMLSVIVRRSTFTIRSTIGMRKTTPGPFGSSSRPSRNTTPRWYSRRIRMKNIWVLSAFWGDGEFEPAFAYRAVHADERLGPCCHRPPSGGDSLAGDEGPEGRDRKADADDESGVDAVRRRGIVEEQRQADAEGDQSGNRQH